MKKLVVSSGLSLLLLVSTGCPTAPEAKRAPGAPVMLATTPQVRGANVSWAPPTDPGTSPITGYQLRIEPTEPTLQATMSGTSAALTGLSDATTYTVRVLAVSAAGASAPSEPMSVTTPGVPVAPASLTATAGIRELVVSWASPADDGGAAITGYLLTASKAGVANEPIPLAPEQSTFTLTGLENGTTYALSILAQNELGDSPLAGPIEATTLNVPDAPTQVAATASPSRATVSWTAPAVSGGSPIQGFVVRASPGGASAGAGPTGSSAIVAGLLPGKSYTFTVEAYNAVGRGVLSAPSSSVTIPAVAACTETVVFRNRPALVTAAKTFSPVIADFNGDGRNDLLYGVEGQGLVFSSPDVNGNFTAPAVVTAMANHPVLLAAAHFDADADLDVVAVTSSALYVLLGNGDGTFSLPPSTLALSGAVDLVTGDFNGDGKQDVASAIRYSDRVTVHFGNGDGTLQLGKNIATGQQPVELHVANLDGAGGEEIIAIEALVATVGRLRFDSTSGTMVHTRLNGLTIRTGAALADLNLDGKVDLVGTDGLFVGDFTVALGKGDGSFNTASVLDLGGIVPSIESVAVLQANGDTHLDVAIRSDSTRELLVLFGQGNGTFRSTVELTQGAMGNDARLRVADFDGDGRAELVAPSVDLQSIVFQESDGQGGFGAASFDVIGEGTPLLLLADANGDGFQDVIAAASQDKTVRVFPGRENGTLGAPFTSATAVTPGAIAAGDFNGDGFVDLAVAEIGGLEILLGEGTGRFTGLARVTVADNPGALWTGDFNKDGRQDLFWAGTAAVNYFPGKGDGTFGTVSRSQHDMSQEDSAFGDFNKDGLIDVVMVDSSDRTIRYGTANGTGRMLFKPELVSTHTPYAVGTGDFDADGDDDFAVSFSNGVLQSFRSKGDGTFEAPVTHRISGFPISMLSRDVDLDGDLDLLVAQSGLVEVLENDGTGAFLAEHLRYPAGSDLSSFDVGDLNGDGRPDLAFASDQYQYDLAGALLNSCQP